MAQYYLERRKSGSVFLDWNPVLSLHSENSMPSRTWQDELSFFPLRGLPVMLEHMIPVQQWKRSFETSLITFLSSLQEDRGINRSQNSFSHLITKIKFLGAFFLYFFFFFFKDESWISCWGFPLVQREQGLATVSVLGSENRFMKKALAFWRAFSLSPFLSLSSFLPFFLSLCVLTWCFFSVMTVFKRKDFSPRD